MDLDVLIQAADAVGRENILRAYDASDRVAYRLAYELRASVRFELPKPPAPTGQLMAPPTIADTARVVPADIPDENPPPRMVLFAAGGQRWTFRPGLGWRGYLDGVAPATPKPTVVTPAADELCCGGSRSRAGCEFHDSTHPDYR